jgi:hypothetical protein
MRRPSLPIDDNIRDGGLPLPTGSHTLFREQFVAPKHRVRKNHMRGFLVTLALVVGLAPMAMAASSPTMLQSSHRQSDLFVRVADGCAAGSWRGPWGECRNTPYSGPTPGGGYVKNGTGCAAGSWRGPWGECRSTPYSGPLPGGGFAAAGNGCPPGYWHGPWGNCRNTAFHGRLPDGSYQ